MDEFKDTSALEPLYQVWEEPTAHRVKADRQGDPAKVIRHRRPSPIVIAQNLRAAVRDWRESHYPGASETTRHLLDHWFTRSHRMSMPSGEAFDFRYYFCQREAAETFIYLKEIRRLSCLSQITADFGGPKEEAEFRALGIQPEEDAWNRLAFKLATGAGKTKCMSLCIVWSYFHALRENDSDMARHFVIIAPNLTVYERLKDDFGDGKIFDTDPLIPSEWRGDWNLSVVLQDEAGGAATGGVLYLTNIHRLYDLAKRRTKDAEAYDWMGPTVSKAKALDTGAALRDRITAHPTVMVLNDEAHHVWDPDLAWSQAIEFLHTTIKSRTGGGLCAQLDFTATPKDNKGQLFKHVVCDTPLGEAVDSGIVKTPILGKSNDKLKETVSDNAAYRFERHLRLGYERWKRSRDEWKEGGKKALMFVMCEDTEAADQITQRLNADEAFKDLNGRTINLHTNLKGKMKKKGSGTNATYVFQESEKDISDDDLKALRKLSRELDQNASPYSCIVSVLMLREGWDVRNVTTIVPLRPYSSKANILPEQTLGRGLRRMTPPGQANEIVTVVEHPAFASLYQTELAQEGLPLEVVDVDKVPITTVSIFPDPTKKAFKNLDIEIPRLGGGHARIPTLDKLTLTDVKKAFERFKPLPLGAKVETEIEYEGRTLVTNELIERFKIEIPIMSIGPGVLSAMVKQFEQICKVQNLHGPVAPLLETFIQEHLFQQKVSIYDLDIAGRLSDADVQEHLRAVFVPLILKRTMKKQDRLPEAEAMKLSKWRPFQVTHSERKPAVPHQRSLFNLTPCTGTLEQGLADIADNAEDVAAFAKNAGPQCLRIDYLAQGGRLSFYVPDFLIRLKSGHYFLVETKGRESIDVVRKAKAALAWCKAASTEACKWEYLYVPQRVFERFGGHSIEELARTCAPSLQAVLDEEQDRDAFPLFAIGAKDAVQEDEVAAEAAKHKKYADLAELPDRYLRAAEDAVEYFQFGKNKGLNLGASFQTLLGSMDEAARGLILRCLDAELPATAQAQKAWFEPYLGKADKKAEAHYKNVAQNLKRTLVFKNGISPIGLLRNCLDYSLNDKTVLGGVFDAVKVKFHFKGAAELLEKLSKVNRFRNDYVAHVSVKLTDEAMAEENLTLWLETLKAMHGLP